MDCWTFFVLIGNGRCIAIDQVRARDLRSAYLEWAKIVEIPDVWLSQKGRTTAWGLPPDIEREFASRRDLESVWTSVCYFDVPDGELPEEWGRNYPSVWVVKTDVGGRMLF
jgi:hypothetical protein